MKTLEHYAKKMNEYENLPHNLSALQLDMSADLGRASQEKMELETKRADYFIENKKLGSEKPVSDTMLEMMFLRDSEGDGQKLLRCNTYVKSLSKMITSCQSHLNILKSEAANQM